MSGPTVNVAFGRLVQAEVDDQLGLLGADRAPDRLIEAANGVSAAAERHELEPDDPALWNAVADTLREIAARRDGISSARS